MRISIAATALAFFLAVAIAANPRPAAAQDAYPSRPVRILLSLPAGSAPDIRTRIVAAQLTTQWGRQVVVENHAGAGGALSVQALLSAPADGYTLLSTVSSVFTVLPAQRGSNLRFDVNRDLVPIALTSAEGMVLAVSSKLGAVPSRPSGCSPRLDHPEPTCMACQSCLGNLARAGRHGRVTIHARPLMIPAFSLGLMRYGPRPGHGRANGLNP